jgi:chorismate mutase
MSPSSRESSLTILREKLIQLNTQYFQIISERRAVSLKVQELKSESGRYSNYDPDREKVVFEHLKNEISILSLKEVLAFSLIMEDQAIALEPGSYPTWSSGVHIRSRSGELYGMINPILLKISHPDLFARLSFSPEFSFLKQL